MSDKHLTKTESKILAELCTGKSNAEIARKMGISLRTVKTHLYRLYPKLGVKNCKMAIVKMLKG